MSNERVSDERLTGYQARVSAFDKRYGAHVVGTQYENGNCDTRSEEIEEAVVDMLRELLPELQQSRASAVTPEMVEAWEPCSPAWLEAGGDCASAPRVWSELHKNHLHPSLGGGRCKTVAWGRFADDGELVSLLHSRADAMALKGAGKDIRALGVLTSMHAVLERAAAGVDAAWRAKGGLNCTEICAIIRSAALSVVSHETGDGESEPDLRQIVADAHENTMARSAGRRGPFIIPDAPTDETQGVKREDAALIERYRTGLEKISAIRDSIIGFQNVGWSEHIYPLVAALLDAGFDGIGYDKARDNARTLLAETKAAIARAETAEASLAAMTEALEYAGKGLGMVHDGLMDPTRPRQSVGEVCSHFLDAARNALSAGATR